MTEKNRKLVMDALDAVFQRKTLDAIDGFFARDYRQHNPYVANGREGLRDFAARAVVPNPDFSARSSHVLADGEIVAVRNRFTGFGPKAHVGFDLFRIQDGTIAEHWDCLQEDDDDTATSFLTAAPAAAPGDSNASRTLVESFVNQVLIAGNLQRFGDYAMQEPSLASLRDACAPTGSRKYERLHRLVADGELVLTQAQGTSGGRPHALYDLFRVSGGKLVAHWGVTQEMPEATASGLGMF
jgi:predicted SnoaL-like aldol condensation-catalyzing enzyme